MNNNSYYVIGVMSGTSLDGIDLCYIHFEKAESWSFKIINSETRSYPLDWVNRLNMAIDLEREDLHLLDKDYSHFLCDVIAAFIHHYNIDRLDAICSHGHTVFHKPEKGITKQIGNLPLIASKLQKNVVCDFRLQDVKLGGQGAPLVPIGDELLFSEYHYCLNLGGFANISFNKQNERIAFDICPVNIVLNHYSRLLGLEYDAEGNIARKGTLNRMLLKSLNELEFYKLSHPKSLGLEWVNAQVFPIIESMGLNVNDILNTFVEHIALQISSQLDNIHDHKVLITGGGVFNNYLIERIKALCSNEIEIPNNEIINFKEALIFGFLGVLKLRNEVNCLKSVTGANRDHSSGKVYEP